MKNKEDTNVAIVTGHSGTIGSAIAQELRKQGYYVIGISRRRHRECIDMEYLADLSSIDDKFISDLEKLIQGKGKLKILVYAAGITLVKPFEEVTRQEYERIINVNLSSAVYIAQLSFKLMKESNEGGVIIFISSQVALPGCAQAYNSIYSMAKSGFNGLVRSLAKEGGPHVRVNAICPGDFHSNLALEGREGFCKITGLEKEEYDRIVIERSAIKRWLDPSEIVNATCFLIKNSAMTGVLLNISGGSLTS
jgi:NAD(P)-dependent dehydrogenase (short-subunit alcohol dehydrogenase family)